MARMVIMMVLCVVVTYMVMAAPYTEAITCDQVITKLVPCIGYLATGGVVPSGCCSGLKELNDDAKSTGDRQTACGCLKSAYTSNSAINPNNAANLPRKCGVNIRYKIGPGTDCSKVQ